MDPAIVDDYFIYNALKWFVLLLAGVIVFLFLYFRFKNKRNKKAEIPVAVQKKERPPDIFGGSNLSNIQTEYIYTEPEEDIVRQNQDQNRQNYY